MNFRERKKLELELLRESVKQNIKKEFHFTPSMNRTYEFWKFKEFGLIKIN
jgi:hypothetical protein